MHRAVRPIVFVLSRTETPLRKLRLDLDTLAVESFETCSDTAEGRQGTVHGNAAPADERGFLVGESYTDLGSCPDGCMGPSGWGPTQPWTSH